MKDKNKMAVLYSLLALAIFSLALAFALSPYPLETIIQLAKAAETAEERAHEQQHNGSNVENGFSPVSPELSKQVTNQLKRVTINLSPKSNSIRVSITRKSSSTNYNSGIWRLSM